MASEAIALNLLGHDIITYTVAITIETVLTTIYSLLVIKATLIIIQLRKRRRTGSSLLLTLALVLVMYFLHLSLWILDLINLVAEARIALIDNPGLDMSVKYGFAIDAASRRVAVIDVLYSYMTILGDIVIIWRVYAFWALGNWRLALIAPIALLIGSMSTSFLLTYCVARLGGNVVLGSFRDPAFCRTMQTASYATPAATTLISTILIGVKAWTYSSGGLIRVGVSRKTKVERVMLLLLESGVAYFIFFTAQIILSLRPVSTSIGQSQNLSFATTVFSFQTSSLVGMYPTIIIWLVHANRSYSETIIHSTSGTTAHSARGLSVPFSKTNVSTSLARSGGVSSQADTLNGRRDLELDIRKEVAIEMDDMSLGPETPSMKTKPSLRDVKMNSNF